MRESPTSTNRRICIRYLTINSNENKNGYVNFSHLFTSCLSFFFLYFIAFAIGFVAVAANVTAAGVVVDLFLKILLLFRRLS